MTTSCKEFQLEVVRYGSTASDPPDHFSSLITDIAAGPSGQRDAKSCGSAGAHLDDLRGRFEAGQRERHLVGPRLEPAERVLAGPVGEGDVAAP